MYIPKIPDNNLYDEISEIIRLIPEIMCEYGEDSVKFYNSVSEQDVIDWEIKNDIILPVDIKSWFEFSNGFDIIAYHMYKIENFIVTHSDLPDDFVIIGIINDESLCFSKETGEIIRYDTMERRRYNDFKCFLRDTLIRGMKKSI